MGRLSFGLVAALLIVENAEAQSALPGQADERAAANAHCAALGEGFFAVTGSSACMRISGHISAGVGFATAAASNGRSASPATGSATEEGVSGDIRFDTPIGPGRIYVHVHNANGSRWLVDGQ
jgi:hypothetical protein